MEFVGLLLESDDLAVKGIEEIKLCRWKMVKFLLNLRNGCLRFDDCIVVTSKRLVVLVIKRNSLVKIAVDKEMHICLDISLQFLDLPLSHIFIPIHEVLQYFAHFLLH